MSRLDDLPPDQRAALSLLLRQHKSYAELATLLNISERAVHDRAQAALAVLAPREARELSPERRQEIGDYLLGQEGVAQRLATRSYLEDSTAARAWASALAAELSPLSESPLPDIPAPPSDAPAVAAAPTAEPIADIPAPAPEVPARGGARQGDPPRGGGQARRPGRSSAGDRLARTSRPLPSSRTGGAVLLAAIVAVVVLAVVLLSGGGGSHKTASTATTAAESTGATGASGATGARASEDNRITLSPPSSSSKSIGIAEVLSEGSKYAYYLAAEHLPPTNGFFYAVWLYNSPTSFESLNRAPAVDSSGRMQGGALLPANAGDYHQMILTRETANPPTHPGPVVLGGAFALH
jgi:hypothetical protein